MGFADRATLEQAVSDARESGRPTGQVLLADGIINADQLAQAVAQRFGLDHIDLNSHQIDMAAANLVSPSAAKRLQAVPVGFVGTGTLLVAMADPGERAGDRRHRDADRLQHPPGGCLRGGHHPPDHAAESLRGRRPGGRRGGGADARGDHRPARVRGGRAGDQARALDHRPGGRAGRLGHPLRARGRRAAGALPHRRRAARHHDGAEPARPRRDLAPQADGRPGHLREAPAPGRPHRGDGRGPPRGHSRRLAAARARRVGGAADPRPGQRPDEPQRPGARRGRSAAAPDRDGPLARRRPGHRPHRLRQVDDPLRRADGHPHAREGRSSRSRTRSSTRSRASSRCRSTRRAA